MSITTTSPAETGNSTNWPEWFSKDQNEAWELFQSLPQPKRNDEPWRFANLKALDLSDFHLAVPVQDAASLITRSSAHTNLAAKLIFANEVLIHNDQSELPAGVLLLPLEQAARDHEELFRKSFMTSDVRLGSKKFAALHRAHLRSGAFVYVPKGVVIEQPIEIWHWVEGENATIFPHTLIVLGEGASATVIDHFVSSRDERSLAIAVNDLTLGTNAKLHYVGVQEWSDKATAFHINTTEVEKEGVSTALQMNLGGAYIRGESDSHLLGEGSRSVMLSINPASGTREIDQRTFQDHFAPRATSDLLYHNALADSSRTIFAGLIKVEEHAHETDAYQKVRNLMLSDEAEANSMPGLEILADNVRCTHGATSGELNEDELFYMMARGIGPKQAAQLIVRGFFGTVLERLENEELQAHLGEILDKKLSTSE
ncbi:MAG: Fe-S cluster assembly protein SufD [Verrucomicrobia bacterium]|nr:Fe-S cluster assembly protein SufD [Verrucomicrobiota bacterium]